MSGTSADGIDAALCEIEGDAAKIRAQILAFECFSWSDETRAKILHAAENRATTHEINRLHREIGVAFGRAAASVREKYGDFSLVASHGQTVSHLPESGATLQIGDAATICELARCDVICDFRARDVAVGGSGAPLVPFADWHLLRSENQTRAVLNLGGIANATILPHGCALDEVFASDIGPANMVIDALATHFFGARYDANGDFAARGNPDESLLEELLSHPFFAREIPKTTGREEFGAAFCAPLLAMKNPFDALATATQLSARSIARFFEGIAATRGDFELILGGGGARNKTLKAAIAANLPRANVRVHEEFSLDSDAKEALCFAMLGFASAHRIPANLPRVTGATRSVVLGNWTRFGV